MRKAFDISLSYLVLAPPIGWLLLLGGLFILRFVPSSRENFDVYLSGKDHALLLLIGIPFAYLFIGLQAFLAGLVTGFMEVKYKQTSIVVPVFAALMAWLVFIMLLNSIVLRPSHVVANRDWLVWLLVHALPVVGVWFLRRWWNRRILT